ncbi:5497_t:CDS:2, partial [Funneliformis caledonium]
LQLIKKFLKTTGFHKDGILPGSFVEGIKAKFGGNIFFCVEFLCVRFVRYFDLENIILFLLENASVIVNKLKNGIKRLGSSFRNWWGY